DSLLSSDSRGLPRLHDGRPELQKPPLYYALVAALGRLRGGVDALAVRLPAALAALATVALLLVAGWYVGRPVVALLAARILATTMLFVWLARLGRIDMPLTLTTTLAAGAAGLALYHPAQRLRLLLVAYLAAAAGVLLKGPIGLVLPASVIAA